MVEGGRRVRRLRATVTAMAAGALSVTGVLATSPRPAGAAPTELFISEYVEGTSNNKAIEIFNGTGASVESRRRMPTTCSTSSTATRSPA